MKIKQSKDFSVYNLFDKYFTDQDDLICIDDFGQREIDTEQLKTKLNANIKAMQGIVKDIELMELKE